MVLLDVDPAIGLRRVENRGEGTDRLEGEALPFHERVRYAFLDLAAAEPGRYLVIDAARPTGHVRRRDRPSGSTAYSAHRRPDVSRSTTPPTRRLTGPPAGSTAGPAAGPADGRGALRGRGAVAAPSSGRCGVRRAGSDGRGLRRAGGPGTGPRRYCAGPPPAAAQVVTADVDPAGGRCGRDAPRRRGPRRGEQVAAGRDDARLDLHRAARLRPLGRRPGLRRRAAVPQRRRLRRVPRLPHHAGGTHADVRFVVPEGLSIAVSEMRALVLRAASAPSGGRWQVVVIEDADRLTEPAGNALLKAIEEPPPRTVFLLCAPSDPPRRHLGDDPLPLPRGHPAPAPRRRGRRGAGPPRRRRRRTSPRGPRPPRRATSAGPAGWPATRRPAPAGRRCWPCRAGSPASAPASTPPPR